jgi:uncharacterized membrane protein SpoIIM required for sporulation
MRQQAFEHANKEAWSDLERTLEDMERGRPNPEVEKLPQQFRKVCSDLALSQQRMYGRALRERLNRIVIGAYGQLQKASARWGAQTLRFVAVTFPAAVRRDWRLFWLNMALCFLPMFAFIAAAQYDPRWIFTLVGPEQQQAMDSMYSASAPIEALREQYGSDFMMWTHYVENNVSIGFRIFAGGVLFTLGAIFFVGFNGLMIGAITGYIHYAGHTENFYRFVVGHSSLELTGMVICGVAGMRLGLALLKPGRLTRREAIREAGARALPLLYGGSMMIFLASFVEGFWSASHAPAWAKYTFGITLWVLMAAYFIFAGRRSGRAA